MPSNVPGCRRWEISEGCAYTLLLLLQHGPSRGFNILKCFILISLMSIRASVATLRTWCLRCVCYPVIGGRAFSAREVSSKKKSQEWKVMVLRDVQNQAWTCLIRFLVEKNNNIYRNCIDVWFFGYKCELISNGKYS